MPDPLRVAIATTSDPLVVLPRLRALCEALEGELRRPTSGHLMISYEELERGAEEDAFHLMWLPPMIACSVLPKRAAHALAIPVRGGHTTYATALITRPDSDVTTVADIQGRSMGWVGRRSSAGYVLPRAYLAMQGIGEGDFGREELLGSHDKVVAAVLSGRVDVGAVYVNLSDGEIVGSPWGSRPVRVLAKHGPIPADLVASGRALDESSRASLRDSLVSDANRPVAKLFCELLGCEGFVDPERSHLDALAELSG